MKQAVYQSVVYKEGKYYVAQCLNIDISSFGDTEQDALVNLRDAVHLYLEDSHEVHNMEIEHPTVHSFHMQYA
jgi:predicted RNase H-like HicB family nuclease